MPNWSVNPTAASARIDAVTSPNPIELRKSSISPPSPRSVPGAAPSSCVGYPGSRRGPDDCPPQRLGGGRGEHTPGGDDRPPPARLRNGILNLPRHVGLRTPHEQLPAAQS